MQSRVPAGAALAVDRDPLLRDVTAGDRHRIRCITPRPRRDRRRSGRDRDGPVIIATGPLTSDALSADIAALVGGDHLYFYDAISPIVLAESIDMSKVFRASRWGRSLRGHSTVTVPGDTRTGTVNVECPRAQLWGGRRGRGLPELPVHRDEYAAFLRRR